MLIRLTPHLRNPRGVRSPTDPSHMVRCRRDPDSPARTTVGARPSRGSAQCAEATLNSGHLAEPPARLDVKIPVSKEGRARCGALLGRRAETLNYDAKS